MKTFILGILAGIVIVASYFILIADHDSTTPAKTSQFESADSQQTLTETIPKSASAGSASEQETWSKSMATEPTVSDADSLVHQSKDRVSESDRSEYSEPQFYLDEYERELSARVDALSELLELSNTQRITLEKRLYEQKEDLIQKVGKDYLDHIMIDEFSIGLEEDLTELQNELFFSYKHEKAMYAATISSEALIAGIKESTGISDERANELEKALITAHYNNRMSDGFANVFRVVEESLTPEEWVSFRTKKK